VDVLVEASRGAALLVVGHRKHVGQAGNAGATATRIIGRSAATVLVHRVPDGAGADRVVRPVLAGVGAGGVDDVLAFAFEEAALRGAPLIAVHVRSHHDGVKPFAGPTLGESEAAVRDTVAGWADKHPGVHASGIIRYGMDVPLPLAAASRMAQLIVVGAPSKARSDNAAATSVSGFLVRRAHCSVAVVPR
jgi:nucleotide-binding universal stress UspA family protein